jgi:hypothetical protein
MPLRPLDAHCCRVKGDTVAGYRGSVQPNKKSPLFAGKSYEIKPVDKQSDRYLRGSHAGMRISPFIAEVAGLPFRA